MGQRIVVFPSQGTQLVGTLYLARGDEPKPTAVVMHGLPGVEKGIDLAHGLRESGWNALCFHYRGCWGSDGDYNLGTIPADVGAALDFLSSGRVAQVDPERLVVYGHSLGSWAALAGTAGDPRAQAVAISGVFCDFSTLDMAPEYVEEFLLPGLRGIDGAKFRAQVTGMPRSLTSRELVKAIPPRPLLIMHGQEDEVIPSAEARELHQAAGGAGRLEVIAGADHDFCWHRRELRRHFFTWLGELGLGGEIAPRLL